MRILLVGIIAAVLLGVLPDTGLSQESVEVFDANAATDAYLATFSGAEREASDAYFEGGYWLILWNMLYGLLVAATILGKKRSARIRDWCEARVNNKFVQTVIYGGIYTVFSFVLSLPISIYQGFFREHQYGLATQSFGPWFSEHLIGLGVGVIMGGLFIGIIYAVIRKTRDHWWIWASGVTIVFLMIGIMLSPVFIEPLFNEYTPLDDPAIEQPILQMARAANVGVDRVYVVDASEQSNRISANVSGFLATKRIALNDNLLNRGSLPEIKAVMGHEIGHYVLNHIYYMILELGLVFAAGFFFINWAYPRAREKWGDNWGIRDISDVAGLPLFSAVFSVYLFAMTPVMNTIIRVGESDADVYGLDAAREPDGFATIALKLGQYRKLEPGYLEEMILFDHPSGRTRIQMAMDWKAEHLDEIMASEDDIDLKERTEE
jgi:Zn-dependent protease with chaperone function